MKDPKPRVLITASGATLLWVAIFAIPVGVFSSSGPLVFLGIMGLLLLGGSRLLAGRQLTGLRFVRTLPERAFLGETFEVESVMENRRTFLTSREILVADVLAGHGGSSVPVPATGPGRRAPLSYPAKVLRRGRLRENTCRFSSRWPFGFFEASVAAKFDPASPADASILIAPNPLLPGFVDHILQQLEQEAAMFSEFQPDDPTEFRSLREFRSGDAIRSVHWPASSRSDSLIVREFDPPKPKPQCHGIFLHQFVPPGELNQPDLFERMLRIASGLLMRFRQRELPVVVRMDFTGQRVFRIPADNHWFEVLDALAEAMSRPVSVLDHLAEGWEIFEDCDQVFVLGDWERSAWEDKVSGKHASVVCLDPYSGAVKKRKARVIKTAGKILTR